MPSDGCRAFADLSQGQTSRAFRVRSSRLCILGALGVTGKTAAFSGSLTIRGSSDSGTCSIDVSPSIRLSGALVISPHRPARVHDGTRARAAATQEWPAYYLPLLQTHILAIHTSPPLSPSSLCPPAVVRIPTSDLPNQQQDVDDQVTSDAGEACDGGVDNAVRTVEYGGDTPIHRQTLRAASGHAFGLVDTSSLKITWGLGFFLGGGGDRYRRELSVC